MFIARIMLIVGILPLLWQCKTAKNNIPPPSPFDIYDDQKCYYNGKLSPEERQSIYPFNKAAFIQVVSFNAKLGKTPILNDTIHRSKIIEVITLSENQKDELTNILFNYNYSEKTNTISETTLGCYFPRHAILFLNKRNKIIAQMEICLECKKIVSKLPEKSLGIFCEGKYELLENFFKAIGIKYFKE